MEPDEDELAAVVDLFGGLTRPELRGAFVDLAARSGESFEPGVFRGAVDRAIEEYYLVAVDCEGAVGGTSTETGSEAGKSDSDGADGGPREDAGRNTGDVGESAGDQDGERPRDGERDELLLAGPASLPTLPDGGDDLPHLLDVERRSVDPEVVGSAALSRLHGEAARAVNEGDEDRISALLDVCYDLEAWAPVETAALRDRLDAAR